MKIPQLHWPAAILAILILSTASCQSDGKKPIVAKAPVSAAPPIKPSTFQTAPPKAAVQAEEKKSVPQPDAIDDLVQRAEQEYRVGEDNYNAGHQEAAKENFDRAAKMLTEHPGGVASDP